MRLANLLLLTLVLAAVLSGQTDTAGLIGLITDPSGAAVAGAKVKLQSRATGAMREQTSNETGLYRFEILPPGEYELTVDAAGFKQFRDSGVRAPVAQISRLDAQLEVGSSSESVEVQAAVSPLNTETATLGTVIGEQKIAQLPLNGRQFIQLALLVPGA